MAADFTVLLSHRWINNFVKYLINSKKIQKNVKFGLQAHINMENKMNGLDRPFGFWILDLWSNAQTPPCIAMHHSPSLSLSIYIYIYEEGSNASMFLCLHHASISLHYFQSSNSRSEPFNLTSILKYVWRPNFIFLGIFLLFF